MKTTNLFLVHKTIEIFGSSFGYFTRSLKDCQNSKVMNMLNKNLHVISFPPPPRGLGISDDMMSEEGVV